MKGLLSKAKAQTEGTPDRTAGFVFNLCYQGWGGGGEFVLCAENSYDLQVLNHSVLLLTSNTPPYVRSPLYKDALKLINCEFNCYPFPERS